MSWSFFFFCSAPATTDIYTLSLTTLFRSLRAFLHLRGHPVSSLVVVVYPGQQPPCRMGSVARGARDSRDQRGLSRRDTDHPTAGSLRIVTSLTARRQT